jgi:hypothetical protein
LLEKNLADNRGFFYGVTSNLVHYALDRTKNAPSGDEFSTVSSKNNFIEMSKVRIRLVHLLLTTYLKKACSEIAQKQNNFTVVHPRNAQKTSYAKTDSYFIPFDDTNDIIEKVGQKNCFQYHFNVVILY